MLFRSHFDEADSPIDGDLLDELRPLGIEAAYGYALAAAICQTHDRHDEAVDWWGRATLLIDPARLAELEPAVANLRGLPGATTLAEAMEADRRG